MKEKKRRADKRLDTSHMPEQPKPYEVEALAEKLFIAAVGTNLGNYKPPLSTQYTRKQCVQIATEYLTR